MTWKTAGEKNKLSKAKARTRGDGLGWVWVGSSAGGLEGVAQPPGVAPWALRGALRYPAWLEEDE
jgi:hypothetical protein